MVKTTSNALIAAIFAIAGSAGMAAAQDASGETATEAAPEAATEAAPAAPAESAVETPAPAADENAEPQPGQSYARETFGDWTMRCVKTPDDQDPCELYQLLRDSDGGAVAEASVVPVQGPVSAIVTFVAPLETDLQHGLRLQIDSNEQTGYPFMVCAQIGCLSRVGLNEEELNVFKRGNSGQLTLLPFGAPEDDPVNLTLSLSGFTAGMNAVTEVMEELTAAEGEAEAQEETQEEAAE